jgi:hypothetical protein
VNYLSDQCILVLGLNFSNSTKMPGYTTSTEVWEAVEMGDVSVEAGGIPSPCRPYCFKWTERQKSTLLLRKRRKEKESPSP